jgi:hypothetical protein
MEILQIFLQSMNEWDRHEQCIVLSVVYGICTNVGIRLRRRRLVI